MASGWVATQVENTMNMQRAHGEYRERLISKEICLRCQKAYEKKVRTEEKKKFFLNFLK